MSFELDHQPSRRMIVRLAARCDEGAVKTMTGGLAPTRHVHSAATRCWETRISPAPWRVAGSRISTRDRLVLAILVSGGAIRERSGSEDTPRCFERNENCVAHRTGA